MVFSRNSQYSRIPIGPHRKSVGFAVLFGLLTLGLVSITARSLRGQDHAQLEWLKAPYIDFVGKDLAQLQYLELVSQPILQACQSSLNWPERFPNRLMVLISEVSEPQVSTGGSGLVRLELPNRLNKEAVADWLTRGLLTHFGLYQGVMTPPPDWLIQAVRIRGALQVKPQAGVLLRRQMRVLPIPSLAECIKGAETVPQPGWSYFLYPFLESGGMDKSLFQERLVQYWANGYDWRQLSEFFEPRYASLNPAELELLWKTFTSEALFTESSACLSEDDSLRALERLAQMEILQNNKPVILNQDLWFLHRSDPVALDVFARKQSELEVLAVRIHPYYFNACHSLHRLILAIETGDLEGFREAARQYGQDRLDAQQLSFETDRLLQSLCP